MRYLLLVCFCISSFILQGQNKFKLKSSHSDDFKIKKYDDRGVNAQNFFTHYSSKMGISTSDEFRIHQQRETKANRKHIKYKQFHNGVEVFGMSYILHEKEGFVFASNGSYLPLLDLDTKPEISPEEAIEYAIIASGKRKFSWDVKDEEKPTPKLYIVDEAYPKVSQNQRLVYSIVLESFDPYDKNEYLVDAMDLEILHTIPRIAHEAVPAKGLSRYYGEVDIISDSIGPNNFVLHDPTRGNNGITTYKDGFGQISDDDNYWDFPDIKDGTVALDAHYCTEKFYDMMVDKLDWAGLDGEGLSMNPIVYLDQAGGDFVNAFWNGQNAFFGNGDCHYGPLTTLDVVGHEFMHGITDYTSNLIYADESGAINESMSDIFGKAVEFYTRPDLFSWIIGNHFVESEYVEPFRAMDDPSIYGLPAHYKGDLWFDGAGVHTNSAIGNHWFYGLVDGESGVNEDGESYDIEGIGMDKALQIVFACQRDFLSENSNYPEYNEVSLLVTEELFGENSPEMESVINAWKAVGLPYDSGTTGGDFRDLGFAPGVFFENVCIFDDFYPFEVTVVNNGTVPYLASENAQIGLVASYEQRYIDIDVDLQPGEAVTYTVDDLVYLVGSDFEFIDKTIEYNLDEDFNNNFDFFYLINASTPGKDAFVGAFADNDFSCYSSEVSLNFTLQNLGCDPFPAGTEFGLEVEDNVGNVVYEETIVLNTELNNMAPYSGTITFDKEPGQNVFSINVDVEDEEPNNNGTSVFISDLNANISGPILIEMDNIFELENSFALASNFYNHIMDYEGESVYANYGRNGFGFTPICPDVDENFSGQVNNSGVNSMLITCLDLEGLEQHNMSFDLLMLYNENTEPAELNMHGSAVKVSIDGSHKWSETISFLDEGEWNYFNHVLPEDFVGSLMIEFFNFTGVPVGYSDFLEYDVTLFDNFQISTNVSSDDLDLEAEIIMSPNPTAGIVHINSDSPISAIKIFDLGGKLIISEKLNDYTHQMDLSQLNDGYYLVEITTPKGARSIQKLVKAE